MKGVTIHSSNIFVWMTQFYIFLLKRAHIEFCHTRRARVQSIAPVPVSLSAPRENFHVRNALYVSYAIDTRFFFTGSTLIRCSKSRVHGMENKHIKMSEVLIRWV